MFSRCRERVPSCIAFTALTLECHLEREFAQVNYRRIESLMMDGSLSRATDSNLMNDTLSNWMSCFKMIHFFQRSVFIFFVYYTVFNSWLCTSTSIVLHTHMKWWRSIHKKQWSPMHNINTPTFSYALSFGDMHLMFVCCRYQYKVNRFKQRACRDNVRKETLYRGNSLSINGQQYNVVDTTYLPWGAFSTMLETE